MNLIHLLDYADLNNELRKIYFLKKNLNIVNYLLIQKINLYQLKDKSLNQKIFQKIKKSGYFYSIKYIYLCNDKTKYFILYLKSNSIIKVIQIHNYQDLKIPKDILIAILKNQLGLPINYISLNKTLNRINYWYKSHGYKWVNIKYFYIEKTNILTFNIYEGKIIKSFFIYEGQIVNLQQKYIINYLNYLIKKELSLFPKNILNINNLNFNINKIKKIYFISNLKYKVENYHNKILITIRYQLLPNNQFFIYQKINIKHILLKIYNIFTLPYKKVFQNYSFLHQYGYILDVYNRHYESYCNLFLYKYKKILFHFLLHLITNNVVIIKIFSTNIKYNNINIDYIIQLLFYNKYFCNYFLAKNQTILKYHMNHENYAYLINFFQYKIKISLIKLKKITIMQYLKCKYAIYEKKICLIYFYQNKIYANYEVINRLYKKYNLFIEYRIKLKQNKLYFPKDYFCQTKHIFNMYYYLYFHLNTKKLNYIYPSKYYFTNIEMNYDIVYQIPKILKKYNIIKIISNINLNFNFFQKLINSNNHNKVKIFLQFDYQIYIYKKNLLYFYIKNIYINKLNLIYPERYKDINYCHNIYLYIKSGIGININTNIIYIPSLKIELQNNMNYMYLIHFYFYI